MFFFIFMENDFSKPSNPTKVWKIPYLFLKASLKETFYLGLLVCKNRKLETYGRKFICKVLPFSIILYELVTHCFNIIGSHESLPLTIEVPTQGHGSGPYHGGIWHAHLLHGVGQVDHDHPHSTRPRLRSIIINIKTWRTYVNHSPICYASF